MALARDREGKGAKPVSAMFATLEPARALHAPHAFLFFSPKSLLSEPWCLTREGKQCLLPPFLSQSQRVIPGLSQQHKEGRTGKQR